MIIRSEQMVSFEAAQWRRFEDEVIARLRESFGPTLQQRGLDDSRLRLTIREVVKRAKKYGVLTEYDVTRFIEYEFEYGEGFDSLPWAAPVLVAASLTGDEKMDRLDALSVFTLR